MRTQIVAVLFLLAVSLSFAALDQSYVHVVARDGSSTMEKTMELAVFSNQLTSDALTRMGAICQSDRDLDCDVDVENKKITIREKLASGSYYSFSSDYGLPYVTYTLVVNSIPSDKFAADLETLLVGAGVVQPGDSSVEPMDLTDKQGNNETVYYLRLFRANITYAVTMPIPITEAYAGEVKGEISGDTARFDLLDVMAGSEPITVKGTEFNLGYMIAIIGIIVIAALAFSFRAGSKPEVPKPSKKKK
ncbi:MAG: hypothetical protein PHF60_05170 [Candidatus ainarchaeum sp.]|nr:hypothetical protein [Candidatus ainarchaeum sp.]